MNYKFPSPSNLKFSNIKIGSEYSFDRIFSNKDILFFANLTGDYNKLHVDSKYKKGIFKQNIVHGMLAASLFSTLVGMHCPGKNCLYLSQEIEFVKPIYPNQKIIVKGTVTSKIKALKILWLKTEILIDGNVVIKGQTKVKVLE
ncbi:MAG: MaoC family dehydratase [bacterium]|nr:MaoC family dehydratase [bacterium]